MRTVERVVMSTLALVGVSAGVSAHPGRTDRYGCHVESATGIRHCHNGTGDGESKLNAIGTAEIAAEAGANTWVNRTEKLGAYGAVHLQHDGSMAFMATVNVIKVLGAVAAYIDLGLGFAWIAQSNIYPSGRVAAGAQIPLYRAVGERSALHLKLGFFMQLVGDDINAEPAGASGVVGWTF